MVFMRNHRQEPIRKGGVKTTADCWEINEWQMGFSFLFSWWWNQVTLFTIGLWFINSQRPAIYRQSGSSSSASNTSWTGGSNSQNFLLVSLNMLKRARNPTVPHLLKAVVAASYLMNDEPFYPKRRKTGMNCSVCVHRCQCATLDIYNDWIFSLTFWGKKNKSIVNMFSHTSNNMG